MLTLPIWIVKLNHRIQKKVVWNNMKRCNHKQPLSNNRTWVMFQLLQWKNLTGKLCQQANRGFKNIKIMLPLVTKVIVPIFFRRMWLSTLIIVLWIIPRNRGHKWWIFRLRQRPEIRTFRSVVYWRKICMILMEYNKMIIIILWITKNKMI